MIPRPAGPSIDKQYGHELGVFKHPSIGLHGTIVNQSFPQADMRPSPGSALARGPADGALGDQGIDLGLGVAELVEHLDSVLTEFGRHAAQAGLAAREANRGGDTFIPILLDHVAAVDGVAAGQRLVDRLHGPRRQARSQQSVAQRFGIVLAEDGGKFGAQRVAVGDTILVARKARVAAEFGLADLLAEFAKGAIVADANENIVRSRREDCIRHEIGMLVSGQRRRLAVHADVKIFVIADPRVRARRRTLEARARGEDSDEAAVLADILKRDERDQNRAVAPLRPAADAYLLDNSQLDIEGGVRAAIEIVEAVRAGRQKA